MKVASFLVALAALLLAFAILRDRDRTRELAAWQRLTDRALLSADNWRALYDRAAVPLFPPGPDLRLDPFGETPETTLVAR
jgi:hypothetical protein